MERKERKGGTEDTHRGSNPPLDPRLMGDDQYLGQPGRVKRDNRRGGVRPTLSQNPSVRTLPGRGVRLAERRAAKRFDRPYFKQVTAVDLIRFGPRSALLLQCPFCLSILLLAGTWRISRESSRETRCKGERSLTQSRKAAKNANGPTSGPRGDGQGSSEPALSSSFAPLRLCVR
jgi:hypothetical protein